MTKDEIYEHLAQVYLGKHQKIEQKKKTKVHSRLRLISNITVTILVLGSVFSGLTAFLSIVNNRTQKSIVFALNNSPIRVKYDLNYPYPSVESFSVPIPAIDAARYSTLDFSIRGLPEGSPGVVKVAIKNQKNETAFYFTKGIDNKWQKFRIPLSAFKEISDWTNLTDVSFVFESWNIHKKRGAVLIDNICFSI